LVNLIHSYLIPSNAVVVQQSIKNSNFITHLAHTRGIDEAKAFIQSVKVQHNNARHNCWGFVAGPPADSMQFGFSDDGEPSGTAGKPILAQLMGNNVGEICAVVTRYYGGVKLGTGGLVRAYSSSVKQGLLELKTQLKVQKQLVSIEYQYAQQSVIDQMLQKFSCEMLNSRFSTSVTVDTKVESHRVDELQRYLKNAGKGKIHLKISNP
jgi:uncharacterized YigZ family protein